MDDMNYQTFDAFASLLFIGSPGSSSYLHQDSLDTNLWSAQVKGEKKWCFFGRDAFMEEPEDGFPNVDKFLKDPRSEIMHVTLKPGEILYFPNKWWHRTKVLKTSISVHFLYITKNIFSQYLKDMFAITLATSLNKELIKEKDIMRHNINDLSCRMFAKMLGFDPEDVLDIRKSSKTKGIS